MSNSSSDNTHYSEYSLILRASKIEGVGVFVTHTLALGAELFGDWILSSKIYKKEDLHALGELRKFLCHYKGDYIGPAHWDYLHISWFLNHSENPNIGVVGGVDGKYITLREIQTGEELLIDYNQIDALGLDDI